MKKPLLLSALLSLSACQLTDDNVPPLSNPAQFQMPIASVSPLASAESETEGLRLSRTAGSATVFDSSKEAFSHRFPDMNGDHRTHFFSGESLFDQNWVAAPASTLARDGLGPLFNARSCAACHVKDGRGNPFQANQQSDQALLVRLSHPQAEGPAPDQVYGSQLQPFALQELPGEGRLEIQWQALTGQYIDGESYTLQMPMYQLKDGAYGPFAADLMLSVRQSPQLIGLGLLEQIPESEIVAQADPEDSNQDGISGRPNRVWDIQSQALALGRFGWKANQPNLKQQVAGAFAGDIGITSSLFPQTEITEIQARQHLLPDGGEPEIDDRLLDRVTFYVQNLAVPARREAQHPDVIAGEAVFQQAKCQQCHRPSYTLKGESIQPYTDLLLHDMGPELADQRPDFEATGQEWRTPPLWGLGLIPVVNGHSRYLHDGRAANLSEAILWHGGEGQASRDAFKAFSASQRNQLIRFLESL